MNDQIHSRSDYLLAFIALMRQEGRITEQYAKVLYADVLWYRDSLTTLRRGIARLTADSDRVALATSPTFTVKEIP